MTLTRWVRRRAARRRLCGSATLRTAPSTHQVGWRWWQTATAASITAWWRWTPRKQTSTLPRRCCGWRGTRRHQPPRRWALCLLETSRQSRGPYALPLTRRTRNLFRPATLPLSPHPVCNLTLGGRPYPTPRWPTLASRGRTRWRYTHAAALPSSPTAATGGAPLA